MRPIRSILVRVILPFFLVGVVAAGGLVIWIHGELDRPTVRSLQAPGTLRVPRGASLQFVCGTLADSGWIRHPRILSLWGAAHGIDRKIQVGRYRLGRGWSPREVIEQICAGRVEKILVTIPEGWREKQILSVLADSLEVDRADLAAAARDTAWMRRIGLGNGRLEGYLFPETYSFPKEYDPREALARMVRESHRRFDEVMRRRAASLGFSRDQVVILASIIQAEAVLEAEMPRISGVFHNRLRRGWKLEADPTVLYALDRFTGPVLHRDLEVESPYNTYWVVGFPPGAIGNPGSAALHAALWPDSNRNEFYFVAKGNGEHRFSRTLAEHNRAKRRIRVSTRGGRQ